MYRVKLNVLLLSLMNAGVGNRKSENGDFRFVSVPVDRRTGEQVNTEPSLQSGTWPIITTGWPTWSLMKYTWLTCQTLSRRDLVTTEEPNWRGARDSWRTPHLYDVTVEPCRHEPGGLKVTRFSAEAPTWPSSAGDRTRGPAAALRSADRLTSGVIDR